MTSNDSSEHPSDHRSDGSGGERRRLTAEALSDPTRFAILELLEHAAEPMDVATITDAVGVHHTAVRAHLTKLRDVGLVQERQASPVGRGRPKLLYAIRAVDPSRPGRDPYRELSSLLARAVSGGVLPREVGRQAGEEAYRRRPDGDTVDLIEAEARDLGFEPRRRVQADDVELVLEHCPFQDVAAEDPQTVCSLHLGIAEGIAEQCGGDVEVLGMVVNDPYRAGCQLQMRRVDAPTRRNHPDRGERS
jgi:predicted ArsR family transcriptional regulator